jgi:hypothetical protein
MSVTPVAAPPSPAPLPRVPRCPATRLTKPECHCPACLFEQITTHGTAAARATASAGVKAPSPAGGIL